MKAVAGMVQMWNELPQHSFTTNSPARLHLFISFSAAVAESAMRGGGRGGDPGVEPNKREALIK